MTAALSVKGSVAVSALLLFWYNLKDKCIKVALQTCANRHTVCEGVVRGSYKEGALLFRGRLRVEADLGAPAALVPNASGKWMAQSWGSRKLLVSVCTKVVFTQRCALVSV